MSQIYEERRPTAWEAWEKRKRTNKPELLGKIRKTCECCGHCTWLQVGKTNEYYCHREYNNGMRVTVDMTGRMPENCEHFNVRSKYAKK